MSVEQFLKECKERVKNKKLDFVPAKKNKESRRKYGLTIYDIEDEILKLTTKDLHKGPEKDRDYPSEYLWIFKKVIMGTIFYIKLKLRSNGIVVCISFHEDK